MSTTRGSSAPSPRCAPTRDGDRYRVTCQLVAELIDTVPPVVLAVYAHPDDPEVACGGTLARWAADGAAVHLLLTCTGDKGTADPQTDPADLVRVRAAEVAAGAAALGLTGYETLGYPDGEVPDGPELRAAL